MLRKTPCWEEYLALDLENSLIYKSYYNNPGQLLLKSYYNNPGKLLLKSYY